MSRGPDMDVEQIDAFNVGNTRYKTGTVWFSSYPQIVTPVIIGYFFVRSGKCNFVKNNYALLDDVVCNTVGYF